MSVYAKRRLAVLAAFVAAGAATGAGAYALLDALRGGGAAEVEGPAPRVVIRRERPQAAQDLGFPAFATKNTTRVAGTDPTADAAGVALAVYPASGAGQRPAAVSLVGADSWQAGVAAAVLAGPPVGAPVLISGPGGVPALTADALAALAPRGAAATDRYQVFRIGEVAAPAGARTLTVRGRSPAAIAARLDRLRERLTGSPPDAVLLASERDPAFAMPAAAWAARFGQPVLFADRDRLPAATVAALKRHPGVQVYALGPQAVISRKALAAADAITHGAIRVGAADPVANAIALARSVAGRFAWNINDPGHGFVVASAARPLDAAAAAALSASGTWGPLLVTDDARRVPAALRDYLLDVKPGYLSDPTRAVYNHVWVIGDESAISAAEQAEIDSLAEVAPVRSASPRRAGGATR